MNIYTLAAKMNKKINKDTEHLRNIYNRKHNESCEDLHTLAKNMALNDYRNNLELAKELREIWIDVMGNNDKLSKTYFITIRPKESIEWIDFYNKVKDFTDRQCFKKFELSFEQKGTDEESIGKGFHTHIIANMTQRSKGEVLRDTISSFKNICEPQCIQVDIIKTDKDLDNTRKYLLEYKSDDNHKETTQLYDKLWRERMGIENYYTCNLPIKSSGRLSITNGCSIVEL